MNIGENEYTLFKAESFELNTDVYVRDIMIDNLEECCHVTHLRPGKYDRYFIGTKLDLIKLVKQEIANDPERRYIPNGHLLKTEEELIQAYMPIVKCGTMLCHEYHAAVGFIVHQDYSVDDILNFVKYTVDTYDNDYLSYWHQYQLHNYIEPFDYVYVDSGHLGFQKEFVDYLNHDDPEDHSKYEAAMNIILDDDFLQEDSFNLPTILGDGYYPIFTYADNKQIIAVIFISDNFINVRNNFKLPAQPEEYKNSNKHLFRVKKNSTFR